MENNNENNNLNNNTVLPNVAEIPATPAVSGMPFKKTVKYEWKKANGKIQTLTYERKKYISPEIIQQMKDEIINGKSIKSICEQFDLSRQTVKKHTGYNLDEKRKPRLNNDVSK